jgi:outer membrane protein OmpA-like peptidoglycan-associated protein
MRTSAKFMRYLLLSLAILTPFAIFGCGEDSGVNPAPVVIRDVADIKPAHLPPLHFRELTSGDYVASLNSDLYFRLDSAELAPKAESQLRGDLLPEVQQFLAGEDEGTILLQGHTDGLGGEQYNLALSRARAESVARLLIAGGIDAALISIEGRGEERAQDDVADPQARRVVVVLDRGAG